MFHLHCILTLFFLSTLIIPSITTNFQFLNDSVPSSKPNSELKTSPLFKSLNKSIGTSQQRIIKNSSQQSDSNRYKKSKMSSGRVRRSLVTDSQFTSEDSMSVRPKITLERYSERSELELRNLRPSFGGSSSNPPYQKLIQVIQHTRSYRDGPINGWYILSTGDMISVSIDPIQHQLIKGRWAVYGGTRNHRCFAQRVYGNGYKMIFYCPTPGVYHAFFQQTAVYSDIFDYQDNSKYRPPSSSAVFFGDNNFDSYLVDPKLFITEYEEEILKRKKDANPWYYSDPFLVENFSNCYRWVYRLIEENEVGFVHLQPNPLSTEGIYREYTLKIWIGDPGYLSEEEMEATGFMTPSQYSQTLTTKFNATGLRPCLRNVHRSIEITSDAEFVPYGDEEILVGAHHSNVLMSPYWKFKLKVYSDRIVSTISDATITITPRQHSSIYECFIGDVRIFIPIRDFIFIPNAFIGQSQINLKHSKFPPVYYKFIDENGIGYFGHEAFFIGQPYVYDPHAQTPLFSNPCINQELALNWRGSLGLSVDFLVHDPLKKIILPSLAPERVALRSDTLQLSRQETLFQRSRINNRTYTKSRDLRINIVDIAFTPVDLILLTDESSVYLHSSDLSIKGIGFNTLTKKYKLQALVSRRWCSLSSTPKSHNMWVPSFARDYGNIIMLYHVPIEGSQIIQNTANQRGCEDISDTTPNGIRGEFDSRAFSEAEIHADEADDARIDRSVDAKLRTNSIEGRIKRRAEEQASQQQERENKFQQKDFREEKTFWKAGDKLLTAQDPHFSSGLNDPRQVRIATTNLDMLNENIVFRIDHDFNLIRKNFEDNGLTFDIDEIVYTNGADFFHNDASNSRLFSLHSVEFTAVEKQYLMAVGFQSAEFRKTVELINTTLAVVVSIEAIDLPVVLNGTSGDEIALEDVRIDFSGTIFRRLQNSKDRSQSPYSLKLSDFQDAQGRVITPAPLSKITSALYPINTALPFYVLRINDVIIFSSLDGSFAKPVLSYEFDPAPDHSIQPTPFLPFKNFEIVVTEKGVISALKRKEYNLDGFAESASEAFVGSILVNEPLRYIHPFHISNNPFQLVTREGEILYGILDYDNETGLYNSPPKTRILSIPFWSLLKGSFARSAGANGIPLDHPDDVTKHRESKGQADMICPFASFQVFFVVYPYVEARYTTRITAEVAFFGESIPLEADILVEFTEVQGVSVVVESFLEVESDQTVIRKTIQIETFIPEPRLDEIYRNHLTVEDDDAAETKEQIRVFTLTIRPSVVNLHCDKKDYFNTIQLNVGCVPFTRMRLIAEAVPLRKLSIEIWDPNLKDKQIEEGQWFYDSADGYSTGISYILVPKEMTHFSQRAAFNCQDTDTRFCKIPIPYRKGVEGNVYGLSFRDTLVPKFEQFLTRHARRVSGNIVMYDILDSYIDEEFQLETNTTQYNARCIVDDGDWYGKLARNANFYRKELSLKADIYRHFNNCFSRKPSLTANNRDRQLPLLPIQALQQRNFFLFNQTNRNALRLKRKRNYIYLIRAALVNTDYNAFSYCNNLDTFFILQVVNMAAQRTPLPWEFYLLILLIVLLVIIGTYFYFAYWKNWRTAIVTNRILAENIEREDQIRLEIEKAELMRLDPLRRLSERARGIEKFYEMRRESEEKEEPVQIIEVKAIGKKSNVPQQQPPLEVLHRRISNLTDKKRPNTK